MHGKFNRKEKPANIEYNKNGAVKLEEWFINGKHMKTNSYYFNQSSNQ
jgi:hypothetical protein